MTSHVGTGALSARSLWSDPAPSPDEAAAILAVLTAAGAGAGTVAVRETAPVPAWRRAALAEGTGRIVDAPGTP